MRAMTESSRGTGSSGAGSSGAGSSGTAELELADWRRRVARLYADVRSLYVNDAVAAWQLWRTEREALYREHSQSPVKPAERAAFQAHHWDYDPRFAFELEVTADAPPDTPAAEFRAETTVNPMGVPSITYLGEMGATSPLSLPLSGGGTMAFRRIGSVTVPLPDGEHRLALYWMESYAGGLFLPFRDATNGAQTYGAGRYLLDAAKSADLGGDPARRTLICDFNFAYQPSCAFDPRWACPLAPPENRLDAAVPAGERLG
jgi:uncharacterized protein (DUF1684 family)